MANQGWIYFLNCKEMEKHCIRIRIKKTVFRKSDYPALMKGVREDEIALIQKFVKPTECQGKGNEHRLFEWLEDELAIRNRIGEGEELVGSYLIEHEPGMQLAGEFRHEWMMEEDLWQMGRELPAALKHLGMKRGPGKKLREIEKAQKRTLNKLPMPLKKLKLRGWLYLFPEDVSGLMKANLSMKDNQLHYEEEWKRLFDIHLKGGYHAAAVVYTSIAYV